MSEQDSIHSGLLNSYISPFPEDEVKGTEDQEETDRQVLNNILDKVEKIEGQLRFIFGKHIVINGELVEFNIKPREHRTVKTEVKVNDMFTGSSNNT